MRTVPSTAWNLSTHACLFADKLNFADSVINKVTTMQKQKDADTYVNTACMEFLYEIILKMSTKNAFVEIVD